MIAARVLSVYLLLRRLVRWIAGSSNDELSTEVELLVLRPSAECPQALGRQATVFAVATACLWPRSAGSFLVLGGPRSWSAHRRSFGGTGSSWHESTVCVPIPRSILGIKTTGYGDFIRCPFQWPLSISDHGISSPGSAFTILQSSE
jgi:hypothetical protein